MKTFFRLLAFAKPIEKFAIPYFLSSLVAIIFSTLNLALLVPLLTILFNQGAIHQIPPKPEYFFDIFKTFNYYSAWLNVNYGMQRTLEYVCATIVCSVLSSNIFRYLAERVMENLRKA